MSRIRSLSPRYYALASRLYPPFSRRECKADIPLSSASQRVMLENGLIDYAGGAGLFHLMPFAMRALEKLCRIISEEMDAIGAQKVQMPSLCERKLLEQTGRLAAFGDDLFELEDRNGEDYFLAPTHEESVTDLAANRLSELSPSAAPLLLYQITSKFRDEKKPRFGLLRGREFVMKDLYSFDLDETEAKETYEMCLEAYDRIFRYRLGPLNKPVFRVQSDVGPMGGTLSHEFHFESDCGEDRIDFCDKCNSGVNRELIRGASEASICAGCGSSRKTYRTVEVGHAFLLGTKYSESLAAYFFTAQERKAAYMASYGIGVTRLLAALIDCKLSQKQQLRWPRAIAPFTLCIIPPKTGSKEEAAGATRFADDVLQALISERHLRGEILYDDRPDLTVGRKLVDAKRIGYPFIVLANKSVVKETIPKLEFFDLTVDGEEKMELVTHEELFSRMRALDT